MVVILDIPIVLDMLYTVNEIIAYRLSQMLIPTGNHFNFCTVLVDEYMDTDDPWSVSLYCLDKYDTSQVEPLIPMKNCIGIGTTRLLVSKNPTS